MAPSIDQIVQQAYQLIDDQPDYIIPKLTKWKKTHKVGEGKTLSACIGCGSPMTHGTNKSILRCPSCRKKISELAQKRKSNFCKNPIF